MTLPTQHLSCGRVARDELRQASNQNGYQKGHESSKSIVQYVSDGVQPSKYKNSYCADVQSKVLTQNGALCWALTVEWCLTQRVLSSR